MHSREMLKQFEELSEEATAAGKRTRWHVEKQMKLDGRDVVNERVKRKGVFPFASPDNADTGTQGSGDRLHQHVVQVGMALREKPRAEQRDLIHQICAYLTDPSTPRPKLTQAAVDLGLIVFSHTCDNIVDELFDQLASAGLVHQFLSTVLALLPHPPHGGQPDINWSISFFTICWLAQEALGKWHSVPGLHAHLLTHNRDALDLIEGVVAGSDEDRVRNAAVVVVDEFVCAQEPAAGLVSLQLSGFYDSQQGLFDEVDELLEKGKNPCSVGLPGMLQRHFDTVEPYMRKVLDTEPVGESVPAVLCAIQRHCFPHVGRRADMVLSSSETAARKWAACMTLGCISHYVMLVIRSAPPDVQKSVLEACRPFLKVVTQPTFLKAVLGALSSGRGGRLGYDQPLQITLVIMTPGLAACVGRLGLLVDVGLPAALVSLMTDDGLMREPHGPLLADYLMRSTASVLVRASVNVAADEGLATAMCRMLFGLLKGRRDEGAAAVGEDLADMVCETLEALVKYGDEVMERRGEMQNRIATQILQLESVKTMMAAAGRRGSKGAKPRNVPKKILDLFHRIEKAETERYEKAIEAEFDDTPSTAPTPATTTTTAKKNKKAGSKKKKGKGNRGGATGGASGPSSLTPVDHDGSDVSDDGGSVLAKKGSEDEQPAKSTPTSAPSNDGQPSVSVPSSVLSGEVIADDHFIPVTHKKKKTGKTNPSATPNQQPQQQLFPPSGPSSSFSRPSPLAANTPPYKHDAATSVFGSKGVLVSYPFGGGDGHEGGASASPASASLSDIMTTATSTRQHSRVPSFDTLPSRPTPKPFPPWLPTHDGLHDNHHHMIPLPPRPPYPPLPPPPRHTHDDNCPQTASPAAAAALSSAAGPIYGSDLSAAGAFSAAADGDVGSPLPPPMFLMFESDENDTAAPPQMQTHPAGDSDISSGGAYQADSGSSSFRDLQLQVKRQQREMEAMRQRQEHEMDEMRQRLAALSAGHHQQQQHTSSSSSSARPPPLPTLPPTQHQHQRQQHQHRGGECSVCMDAPASVVYMPCRHLRVCPKCYDDNKARVARELTRVRAENDRRKQENEDRIRQNKSRKRDKQLPMVKLLDEPHYVCEHCNGTVEFGGSVEEALQWVANNLLK
ncbi:unnamed protein product [Vitrella brassicaformis CCMP3155]|uniref:RING-type domain-containing protein n=2 Tax=Vitrella brassicaformis TaxID=1169539 RepID=A0A0G4EKB9_VITBC|nr:unnamed protein product [Vitrella brassicaformis CCMP3155]|eukprot:CEL96866.1 unnamed protein product [Vitrella brassicaformis CCMP3155]